MFVYLVYVSTVRNPSVNRKSDASTLHTSNHNQHSKVPGSIKRSSMGETIDIHAAGAEQTQKNNNKNSNVNYLDY